MPPNHWSSVCPSVSLHVNLTSAPHPSRLKFRHRHAARHTAPWASPFSSTSSNMPPSYRQEIQISKLTSAISDRSSVNTSADRFAARSTSWGLEVRWRIVTSRPWNKRKQTTHQRPVYQLHIIRCGTTGLIVSALKMVKDKDDFTFKYHHEDNDLMFVLKDGVWIYSRWILPLKLIYTGRWWVGCYIWYSDEGTGRGPSPPRLLPAVPNAAAHPSTASVTVPITVLLYNSTLLCSFNVAIKGLMSWHSVNAEGVSL